MMSTFLHGWGLAVLILLIASAALNIALTAGRRKEGGALEARGEKGLPDAHAGESPEDVYGKFFPDGILSLLNIESYSRISVGDQQYFSSVIMEVNTAHFSEFAHGKQPADVFTYINSMLNRLIPIVYEKEGMVESFSEGGLTAFYRENREKAMAAAVSICETMNEMSRKNPEYRAVTAGLCYGPLMIGAVGHERRMNILILSESKEFARFLQSIGPRYYAKIIVTASFMEAIGDGGGRFNYRLLGYVYLHASKTIEKIYDVFDGDEVEVRNRKRKTKMVFEKGVALFTEGRMPEARQHFIEVMKMDHQDKAAREYLLRCDKYLSEGIEGSIYLDTY